MTATTISRTHHSYVDNIRQGFTYLKEQNRQLRRAPSQAFRVPRHSFSHFIVMAARSLNSDRFFTTGGQPAHYGGRLRCVADANCIAGEGRSEIL